MAARRSPNYPALSFPEALSIAEKLYNEAQRHRADRESILAILGYKGMSGRSQRILGALNAYGLVEGSANSMGVSKDAESIIVDPHDSDERNAAVLRCAFAPPIFQMIRTSFNNALPGDQLLKAFLLKRGYVHDAVNRLIDIIKDTYNFVQDVEMKEKTEYTAKDSQETQSDSGDDEMNTPANIYSPNILGNSSKATQRELFSYDFEPSGSLRLLVSGEVDTEEALDVLASLIDMKKKELARKKKQTPDVLD